MTETENRKLPQDVSEVLEAEQKRARGIAENPVLKDWVQSFRQKYIVSGYLSLLYNRDGRSSRPRNRVSKFGNYILTEEIVGN